MDNKLINIIEIQLDIGSATNINSPKFLTTGHKLAARSGPANKAKNYCNF